MAKGKGGAPIGNKNAAKMFGKKKSGIAGALGVRHLTPIAKQYGAAMNAKAGTKTAILTQSGLNRYAKTGMV